jgi:membrane-bound lytic murein transglycosylase D
MQQTVFGVTFFLLALLVGNPSAKAALIIDPNDTYIPVLHDQDGDDTPHELFPLAETSLIDTEPIRTEAPTFQSLKQWNDLRGKILSDFGNRISSEFHIQDGLKERTKFWFDIYTRYGEAHHVIHHVLYPWIVFKVVDTSETLQNGKGPQWLRRDRAEKLARAEAQKIRKALKSLASRRDYSKLPPLEKDLFNRMMTIKGPRRKVFQIAANNVRSQLGQKDFFERGLVNSSRYLPYMEDEFKRIGLPTELTRMPFVESSFNEDARSKVGASGIWQIMPRTGKAYMIVNDQIDERNNPIKATTTAGRLLHSYHHALDSWPLTITSYNHGIGNIQKAIRKARTRDLALIIERYHDGDFKFASSNFYTCFLAALYAEKYHELIFKEVPREPLQEMEVFKLSGRTGIRHLQKLTGLDAKELTRYNLDLRSLIKNKGSLPRGFKLHLPPSAKDRVMRQIGTQDKKSKART